jgi:hypothetical protein
MDKAILKFKLTNFIGAFVSEIENAEGNIEECVCIPLNRNNLKKTHNNTVSAYCFVNQSKIPLDGWTHYIQLKAAIDFVKKLNVSGYRLPYLGNIKQDETMIDNVQSKNKYVRVSRDG